MDRLGEAIELACLYAEREAVTVERRIANMVGMVQPWLLYTILLERFSVNSAIPSQADIRNPNLSKQPEETFPLRKEEQRQKQVEKEWPIVALDKWGPF